MKPSAPSTFWSALALAATLSTLGGCAPSGPADGTPATVEASTVRVGHLEDRFLLTGELQAVLSSALTTPRTPTWSVTIEWMETEGTHVEAGTPVVQFDSTSVLSTLEDKRLAVTESEKELLRRRIDLSVTRYEKTQELQRKEIARQRARLDATIPEELQPQRDYQDAQLELQRADAELEKARRDLEAFEQGAQSQIDELDLRLAKTRRDLDRAESALEQLTLRAPASGVLLHGSHPWEGRKWEVGDTTWPGTTVAEVPDLNEMEVIGWLSDVDDGEVLPGMPARCILDTYPGRSFAGHVAEVTEVAQEPDRNSSRRFFRVLVRLDDIDPEIMRPGMSVKVEVVRNRWSDVRIVPRQTLAPDGDQHLVSLPGGGTERVTVLGCNAVDCAVDEPQVAVVRDETP
jgi:multidrug efflux pump subunit AcrA (membrane-fusion protein)